MRTARGQGEEWGEELVNAVLINRRDIYFSLP